MNKVLISAMIYLLGVIASSFSQIALKKSAGKKYDKWYKEYLNLRVIISYAVFFGATLCTVLAYKYLPLSMGPILGATEYIFVAILSYICLKEKIGKKKLIGLMVIITGVIVFSVNI